MNKSFLYNGNTVFLTYSDDINAKPRIIAIKSLALNDNLMSRNLFKNLIVENIH